MTAEMSAQSPAGDTLSPLHVYPLAPSAPVAADLRRRASRLFDPGQPIPGDVAWSGDHVLNPDWAEHAPQRKAAAVLVLLAGDRSGDPVILLTERAAHLSAHAGQIALPGGKIEPGETPGQTALREAEEEVALPARAVELVGLTEPYATRTGFLVTPVVGILRAAAQLRPDPGEVAGAFVAPWSYVMDQSNTAEIRLTMNGRERRALEIHWGSKRIWGVTAGILRVVQERLFAL